MNTLDVLNTLDPHARLPNRRPGEDCNPWDDLKHRRGRFKITSDLINDSPETAMRVFGKMIIVRAEHSFVNDIIEYDAYSPLFRALSEGEKAPFYDFEVDDEGPVKAIEIGTR